MRVAVQADGLPPLLVGEEDDYVRTIPVIGIRVCESYLVNGRVGNEVESNPQSGYQALTGTLLFCNFRTGCNV